MSMASRVFFRKNETIILAVSNHKNNIEQLKQVYCLICNETVDFELDFPSWKYFTLYFFGILALC